MPWFAKGARVTVNRDFCAWTADQLGITGASISEDERGTLTSDRSVSGAWLVKMDNEVLRSSVTEQGSIIVWERDMNVIIEGT